MTFLRMQLFNIEFKRGSWFGGTYYQYGTKSTTKITCLVSTWCHADVFCLICFVFSFPFNQTLDLIHSLTPNHVLTGSQWIVLKENYPSFYNWQSPIKGIRRLVSHIHVRGVRVEDHKSTVPVLCGAESLGSFPASEMLLLIWCITD